MDHVARTRIVKVGQAWKVECIGKESGTVRLQPARYSNKDDAALAAYAALGGSLR